MGAGVSVVACTMHMCCSMAASSVLLRVSLPAMDPIAVPIASYT